MEDFDPELEAIADYMADVTVAHIQFKVSRLYHKPEKVDKAHYVLVGLIKRLQEKV